MLGAGRSGRQRQGRAGSIPGRFMPSLAGAPFSLPSTAHRAVSLAGKKAEGRPLPGSSCRPSRLDAAGHRVLMIPAQWLARPPSSVLPRPRQSHIGEYPRAGLARTSHCDILQGLWRALHPRRIQVPEG